MLKATNKNGWLAAIALLIASSASAIADEGVVRISDEATRPAVINMNSLSEDSSRAVQQTAYAASSQHLQQLSYGGFGQNPCIASDCQMYGYCGDQCGTTECCDQGCGLEGCCDSGRCRRRRGNCNQCECDSFGECHNDRMLTLFAKPLPKSACGGRERGRCWRGHQMNYLNRNQRLANHLFGWLVPSGCCGQGCPPVGKYCVNYAQDPGYSDSRDGQAYGAQGYGVPVTVPLAPNVRHSYNYSWGTPSSRITPMGNYSPGMASHQPLYHQSW